ncbi:nucleic acid-binding protein [Hypoxylon fragiforme]|uniref:nucleic acid-binding protein n=1 Tax=Hypoxylon fragiforme TaxID=63214 RepID=UPI0020C69E4F|nr:nucleic acid-binding protein [Hypoxylon fragiforme]KAI2613014.1 nucleic acid-binding protein [Hypoxylon fragiforme]
MSFLARRATAAAPSLARAFSASARRDIAKITLVGNLAASPEVRPTSTGREILEYSVASNSGPKDNRQTSWFKVAAFIEEGPRRDFLTSLPKGSTVYVEGDAVMSSFTDGEGKTKTSLSIYQKNLEVLKRPAPTE